MKIVTCISSLQWRHNGRDGVSNHQPHHCLLNRSFRRRLKKTSKLSATGLCVGNSPMTGEFPAQMASNAENVSIWWRHHGNARSVLRDELHIHQEFCHYRGVFISLHRLTYNPGVQMSLSAIINSLWTSNAIWLHKSGLTAPSPYLNHYWLIIGGASVAFTKEQFRRKCSRYQFIEWVWKIHLQTYFHISMDQRGNPWWRHQMETFSDLLAICAGNSPVTGEFPAQRPVTRSFGVFFDLRLNKRLSKHSWGWWFDTHSPPLWRHSNAERQNVVQYIPYNMYTVLLRLV